MYDLITGIKDNRLISRPIQQPSQEFDVILMNVPKVRVVRNSRRLGFIRIRIGD